MRHLLPATPRLTLEVRFVLAAALVIALATLTFNYWFASAYRDQANAEVVERAQLLAHALESSLENTLLFEQLGLIHEEGLIDDLIDGVMTDVASNVVEIRVYDSAGRLRNSSNLALFADPRENRLEQSDATVEFENLDPVRFRVRHVLAVSSRRLGTLQMTFTRRAALDRIAAFRGRFHLATAIAVFFALAFSLLLARTLARPIKELSRAMQHLSAPEYEVALKPHGNDEIGDLQQAFVAMLGRLRRTQAESREQQRALAQAERLATVGTLAAGLAHEINNPLAGARNCLARLQRQPERSDQVVRYAALMDSALERIEQIVRDLLDYTRRPETAQGTVDLAAVVAQTLELASLQADRRGVRCRFLQSSRPLRVRGSAQHLQQMAMNLLLNAIAASDRNDTIEISLTRRGPHAALTIRDHGRGIPAADRERIFDPFFTTKAAGEGTGLGLWIVREIVTRHDGTIDLSGLAPGTEFRVELPLLAEDAGPGVAGAVIAGGRSRRMGRNKGLLQVADATMLEHSYRLLRSRLPEVVVCGDAENAYSDLGLPVINDAVEGCGPLGGVLTALRWCPRDYCLLLPCDLPRMEGRVLDLLLDRCADQDAVIARSPGGLEPLVGLYHRRCRAPIEAAILRGDYALRRLLAHLNAEIVDVCAELPDLPPDLFANINTPGDLRNLPPTPAEPRKEQP